MSTYKMFTWFVIHIVNPGNVLTNLLGSVWVQFKLY